MQTQICVGCGLETEVSDGATHKYLESSPGCWALFGEVLAREYEHHEYMAVHALTVDAYALQHPGHERPQTIRSTHVHLGSLYSYFELGKPISELAKTKQKLAQLKSDFYWLEPPQGITDVTVADVLISESASQHCENVERWAYYVYQKWKAHHPAIANLLRAEDT